MVYNKIGIFLRGLILTFVCINQDVFGFEQSLNLYTGFDCTSEFLSIEEKTPDLKSISFDNKAVSVKSRGTWLLYGSSNYNLEPGNSIIRRKYHSTNYLCQNLGSASLNISSVRYVGFKENIAKSILTLFQLPFFEGNEIVVDRNRTSLDAPFQNVKSLFVNGPQSWSVYSSPNPNYEGQKRCIVPSKKYKQAPRDISNTTFIIRSVHAGC